MAYETFWQDDQFYLSLIQEGLAWDGSPDLVRIQRFYNPIQAFQSAFDLEGDCGGPMGGRFSKEHRACSRTIPT